jgi:hypothetical protein
MQTNDMTAIRRSTEKLSSQARPTLFTSSFIRDRASGLEKCRVCFRVTERTLRIADDCKATSEEKQVLRGRSLTSW